MGLMADEMETIIRIGKMDSKAIISTTDNVYMTKLDKLCEANPDEWKCTGKETSDWKVIEKYYECPKNLVSFRAKTGKGRELTEEQKQKMREGFIRSQNAQNT